MKKHFFIFKILLVSLVLVGCGHSQSILPGSADAVPALDTSDGGNDELEPENIQQTSIALKEFESLRRKPSEGLLYSSPLTLLWQEVLKENIQFSTYELNQVYSQSLLDSVLSLSEIQQLDWFNLLPKIGIDPWFATKCKICKIIESRAFGSSKQALTGESTPPVEIAQDGYRPATAYDPINKHYIIVWSEKTSTGGSDIFAKLLDQDGSTVVVDEKIISVARPTQGCLFANFSQDTGLTSPTDCKENVEPSVAYNGVNFLITWTKRGVVPAPAGQKFSGVFGKLVLAQNLEPAHSDWSEGILLSKISFASSDPSKPAKKDSEIQAWSLNEHSDLSPYFGAGVFQGAFLLVWDTNKDYINCLDASRRTATSVYGRVIPTNFNPRGGNRDVFAIFTDSSTARPECAPNADVSKGSKPKVALLKTSKQFLTVFETSKNVADAIPSVSGKLITVGDDLSQGVTNHFLSDTVSAQMHEGSFDPDVVAAADRFVVVNQVGNENLKLTPVTVVRGNITAGDSSNFTTGDGRKPLKPAIALNRVIGEEETGTSPLEYVIGYESWSPENGVRESKINVVSFNENLIPAVQRVVLGAGFNVNLFPVLASAGGKALTVWSGEQGSESRILASIITLSTPSNQKPSAQIEVVGHAENPPQVTSGDVVILSGEQSRDPEGSALSYAWRQLSGPSVNLGTPVTSRITFTAPEVTANQNLVFELKVTDAQGLSSDAVTKMIVVKPKPVQNQKPVARISVAGHNEDPAQVLSGETVDLSGTQSSDPEGESLTYAWRQVSGPSITFNSSGGPTTSFVTPTVTTDQNIVIELKVTDARGLSSNPVTKTIVVKPRPPQNQQPVAVIEVTGHSEDPAQVLSGETVNLSGAQSRDPDLESLTYAWRQVSGPNVTLNGNSSVSTSFVAPTVTSEQNVVIELRVRDARGLSSNPVTKTIVVKPQPANEKPIARIEVIGHSEDPAAVVSGDGVTLSATFSNDPEGGALTYQWRQVSGPTINLIGDTNSQAAFTAPSVTVNQNIVIELKVFDSLGLSSDPTTKTIVVHPLNNRPIVNVTRVGGGGGAITTLTVDESVIDPVIDSVTGTPSWPRTRLTLSGIQSNDGETPPGSVSGYFWEQIGATTGTAIEGVSTNNSVEFSFLVPDVSKARGSITITIRLTVSDQGLRNNTASQDLVITVNYVNHRPTAPVLLTPNDGILLPPSRAALTWQASQDPDVATDGDRLVYDVYFGTQNPPTTIFSNCNGISQTKCVVDQFLPNNNHYWRVAVRDSSNEVRPSLSSAVRGIQTDNSVLARWSFDDGPNGLCPGDDPSLRGIRVCDQSGYGWNGIISDRLALVWLQNGDSFLGQSFGGILGRALGFQMHHYMTSSFVVSNTSQESFEFWLYPVRQEPGVQHSIFYSEHPDAGGIVNNNLKRIEILYDGDSSLVHFRLNTSLESSTNFTLSSIQPLQLNQWNHLVCTFGPNGLKIFINGVLSSLVVNQSFVFGNYAGSSFIGGYSSGNFWGAYDEANVYNVELSSNVIVDLFNAH
ncbi:MAG: hypothetical protein A3F82_10245 [Deltaproteobacteria bacterium RIFCSPLOWO2_12_FULL_44_12]|nr:MAG: hypothetical protein A2712_00085 [Deltaproteobacteria bacterium RIFCSPHIGHO2_01_FULL_43_49]OGQ15818.1 MAG: hypothetical protein A3D22_02735 [Deltaproteobacteria bacterium RIFCSPHIGHO2_02_FULL_44_53]OGQ28772.1 MAG: hypothetical protein A3D98_01065 [Deltaproteobacteria bacterium RIFCSPHIGHO2_12_FULL_44_21]OGQ32092.1 MAG: hypothetical protein A2979_03190 [Deltaproteobacteria bacterium RIFCSPLOWO2_01_FULL_45_74]OGQ43764.1 MAG: hypothetical protein A3I70_05795 [Deltaproteobacteria bacterium 